MRTDSQKMFMNNDVVRNKTTKIVRTKDTSDMED